jgi:hypothetical protein
MPADPDAREADMPVGSIRKTTAPSAIPAVDAQRAGPAKAAH